MSPDFQAFWETRKHQSAATLDIYRGWLTHFEAYCLSQGLDWRRSQPSDLERYRQKLLWSKNSHGRLYSPNTVHQALRVVRHLYRWAHRCQLVPSDPTAAWKLSKPTQPTQLVLSHEQILKLFNLPDLATPTGLRDLLLLELIYSCSLSLASCHPLTTTWQDRFDGVKPIWDRYLEHGRPRLQRQETDALLLTNRGQPFECALSLGLILFEYGRRLELPARLHARALHRSAADHQSTLARRFQISKDSARLRQ